jgi:Nuclease-related domain
VGWGALRITSRRMRSGWCMASSLVVAALAAVAAGWGLRFRPSPDAVAWRRGAAGERRTARLLAPLERQGWAILHDLAGPGSRANIDHLVIGPAGVFVIDSKQYRGRLHVDPMGRLWHGRYPLAPVLRTVSFEADQAAQILPDPGVAVVPIVAVHGAQVPGARWLRTGCRWWRPGACQACFGPSRRCWRPSGSPAWPIGPGFAFGPPLDPTGCAGRGGDADTRPAPAPATTASRPTDREHHELRLEY